MTSAEIKPTEPVSKLRVNRVGSAGAADSVAKWLVHTRSCLYPPFRRGICRVPSLTLWAAGSFGANATPERSGQTKKGCPLPHRRGLASKMAGCAATGSFEIGSTNKLSLFLLIFILLAGLNYYVFRNKDDGWLYRYVGYGTLYCPAESQGISGFDLHPGGELQIKLTRQIGSCVWQSSVDGIEEDHFYESPDPIIKLIPGSHTYHVRQKDAQFSFSVSFLMTPSKIYSDANYKCADNYEFLGSSLPLVNFPRHSIYDFAYKKSIYPQEDVAEAQGMLKNEMGLKELDSTEDKIIKIACFLQRQLSHLPGIPGDEMKSMSPLKQYHHVLAGDSGLWCSNFAMIFTFFATCADIPTRLVALKGNMDGFKLSGHIFTESYVPEQQRWALVDITSNTIMLKTKSGEFMNALGLLHAVLAGNTDGISAVQFGDDGAKRITDFRVMLPDWKEYLNQGTSIVFYFPYLYHHSWHSKISHYILKPDLAYSLSPSNNKHYLKLLLFYSAITWGFFCFSYLILFLKGLLVSRRERSLMDEAESPQGNAKIPPS
ncbi:MAG: hypothetical protein JW808_06890 [Victivallales bacterium]|nr:hypothetical protein [Victivallales bacterium]